MHTNLIILAGGASSRMKKSAVTTNLSEAEIKAANSRSKALLSLGNDNRPILDYLLLNAKKAGYKKVFLVVGENSDAFKSYYGNKTINTFNSLELQYAIQYIPSERSKPFGTADALYQALEQFPYLINETFTVCNSDNLYSVEAFTALRKNTDANAFISYDRDGLKFSLDRIARFALVVVDQDSYLTDIVEKPMVGDTVKYKDADGKYRVSMNAFKLNGRDIYPYLKNCPVNPDRNEKELPTAVLNLCKSKSNSMKGIPFCEHVPDLTSKEDIGILKKYIQDNY